MKQVVWIEGNVGGVLIRANHVVIAPSAQVTYCTIQAESVVIFEGTAKKQTVIEHNRFTTSKVFVMDHNFQLYGGSKE